MAIIVAADLRSETLAEFCSGLELGEDEVPDDADITAAIARCSHRFDEACNDRFESFDDVLSLNGGGVATLVLPHRTTGIDYVITTDIGGTDTFQPDDLYRLVSSLDADGARALRQFDHLGVTPGQVLSNVPFYGPPKVLLTGIWPDGPNTVTVAGTFGWTTTPPDVKRAVALLVWDHFKQRDPDRRRATQWRAGDSDYVATGSEPFGLPEVDQVVTSYRRVSMVPV